MKNFEGAVEKESNEAYIFKNGKYKNYFARSLSFHTTKV